jgi:CRISPR-associated protein Cas6
MIKNMTDITADMVDVQFSLRGRLIVADYADALCNAVEQALPWFLEDSLAGIHPLSSLSPGEGGWYLSRRSRLTLRLPRERVTDAMALTGAKLALGEHVIEVGDGSIRELEHAAVLYCKFVVFEPASATGKTIAEDDFMSACRAHFAALGIRPEMICGKARQANITSGLLSGFSLLLSGIGTEDNLQLQRHGLGLERKRGCGIFIPHKTFAAMGTLE